MLLSEMKSVQHQQVPKLKKPRPPSNLTRYGAIKEFSKNYPESFTRIKSEGFLTGSQIQLSSNKNVQIVEDEEQKFKRLRFPLLGPTREETCIFLKFQKKKGVKSEAVTKEKISFIESPLSSPSKTPCIALKRRKLPSLASSNIDDKNMQKDKVILKSVNDGRPLLEIGRECTQRLLFPQIKSEKTIVPSKYGYHPRSHSPTYKYLVQCRQKLEDLMGKKINQQGLKNSSTDVCLKYDKLDGMIDNHSVSVQLDLPITGFSIEEGDLSEMQNISPRNILGTNQGLTTELNDPKALEFLPKIVVPVADIDPYEASCETDDDSVSMEDISKWESTLKEKMSKVQASGKSFMKEDTNSSSSTSRQISKQNSLQDFSEENKKKIIKGGNTGEKKSKRKKKNSKKNLKTNEIKVGNKTLNSNKLIYDKTKQHAVSKVASQHGLTEEEANDLYLTRDSRIVTQKYIDRLNQMAFGSDESDSEEYDVDSEL